MKKSNQQQKYDQALTVFQERRALDLLPNKEQTLKKMVKPLFKLWAYESKAIPGRQFADTCDDIALDLIRMKALPIHTSRTVGLFARKHED